MTLRDMREKHRSFDKRRGHGRFEFSISIKKLVKLIKGILGKGEEKSTNNEYKWVCENGHSVPEGSQNSMPYCRICGGRLKMVDKIKED